MKRRVEAVLSSAKAAVQSNSRKKLGASFDAEDRPVVGKAKEPLSLEASIASHNDEGPWDPNPDEMQSEVVGRTWADIRFEAELKTVEEADEMEEDPNQDQEEVRVLGSRQIVRKPTDFEKLVAERLRRGMTLAFLAFGRSISAHANDALLQARLLSLCPSYALVPGYEIRRTGDLKGIMVYFCNRVCAAVGDVLESKIARLLSEREFPSREMIRGYVRGARSQFTRPNGRLPRLPELHGAIDRGWGTEQQQAILFAALLRALGADCRIVTNIPAISPRPRHLSDLAPLAVSDHVRATHIFSDFGRELIRAGERLTVESIVRNQIKEQLDLMDAKKSGAKTPRKAGSMTPGKGPLPPSSPAAASAGSLTPVRPDPQSSSHLLGHDGPGSAHARNGSLAPPHTPGGYSSTSALSPMAAASAAANAANATALAAAMVRTPPGRAGSASARKGSGAASVSSQAGTGGRGGGSSRKAAGAGASASVGPTLSPEEVMEAEVMALATPPPLVWVEVYLRDHGVWAPVFLDLQHVGSVPMRKGIRAYSQDTWAFVASFNENRRVHDVTFRYNPKLAKVEQLRGAEGIWWDETILSLATGKRSGDPCSSAASVAVVEHPHDAADNAVRDQALAASENCGLPPAITAYRDHPRFAMERFLKANEVIHPQYPVLGTVKGSDVFPRKNVLTVRDAYQWETLGRLVLPGEKPLKVIKREGDKPDRELFSLAQTDDWPIPKVENGIVPKNQFRSVEVYRKRHMPQGAALVPSAFAVPACVKLKVDYALAHSGWKRGKTPADVKPLYSGAVVPEESYDAVNALCYELAAQDLYTRIKAHIDKQRYHWAKLASFLMTAEVISDRSTKYRREIPVEDFPHEEDESKSDSGMVIVKKRKRNHQERESEKERGDEERETDDEVGKGENGGEREHDDHESDHDDDESDDDGSIPAPPTKQGKRERDHDRGKREKVAPGPHAHKFVMKRDSLKCEICGIACEGEEI